VRHLRYLVPVLLALILAGTANASRLPVPASTPSALWVGDSYTMGVGAAKPWISGESYAVSRALGWKLTLDAAGGTGFVAPSRYGPPFWKRLPSDVARIRHPDFVVIDGGRNDHGDSTTERRAVSSYFNAVARDFPGSRVLVIAPWIMRSHSGDYSATRAILAEQAASHGWAYIDPLAMGWIGPVTAGLVCADGVHPSSAGYAYAEQYLVPAIAAALSLQ